MESFRSFRYFQRKIFMCQTLEALFILLLLSLSISMSYAGVNVKYVNSNCYRITWKQEIFPFLVFQMICLTFFFHLVSKRFSIMNDNQTIMTLLRCHAYTIYDIRQRKNDLKYLTKLCIENARLYFIVACDFSLFLLLYFRKP